MFINIACDCEWKPVNYELGKPYKFPNEITEYMKDCYSIPAVYRWVIDNEMYYVGESKNICRRINAYLRAPEPKFNEAGKMLPHQQTTNINMHAKLRASSSNRIEVLAFDELKIGDATYTPENLNNNRLRLLIEKIAILDHAIKHQKLLNR